MAKNISKFFGLPSTREGGFKQHKELVQKLRRNGVYSIPFMNRGYLVLRKATVRMYPNRPRPHVDIWSNYLQSSKPTGKYLKVTKV